MFYARKTNRSNVVTVNSAVAPAWGTIDFTASGNPGNGQTITIAGTLITFVTGTPSGAQVKIGASLAATLAALAVYLAAHPIATANVSVTGNSLLVLSTKPADTTVTLAASNAAVSSANLVPQTVRTRLNVNNLTATP